MKNAFIRILFTLALIILIVPRGIALGGTPSGESIITFTNINQLKISQQGGVIGWTDEEIIELGYVPHEIVVEFKKKAVNVGKDNKLIEQFANSILEGEVLELKETLIFANAAVFRVQNAYVENYVAALRANPQVTSVTPNYVFVPSSVPNDPLYNQQWGLNNPTNPTADIDIENAWNIGTGSHRNIVAILDTGVSFEHPDLRANIWTVKTCYDENGNINPVYCKHGWDYVNNDNTPWDDHGHGTQMAGIIAAETNNNTGIAGINHNIRIMPVKVATSYGTMVDIVKGIQYAQNNKARIINASFGLSAEEIQNFSLLENAITQFTQTGIFIASAGNTQNSNDLVPYFPSSLPNNNLIAVTASNQNDSFARQFPNTNSGSNWGATSVDVFAPGTNIPTTNIQNIHISSIDLNSFVFNKPANGWVVPNAPMGTALFTNNGTYSNSTSATAITPQYDLSGRIDPDSVALSTTIWCDTEPQGSKQTIPDYLTFSVSSDGGQNWAIVPDIDQGRLNLNEEVLDKTAVYVDSNNISYAGKTETLGYGIPPQHLSSNTQFKIEWITDNTNVGGPYLGCILTSMNLTFLEAFETGVNSTAYTSSTGTSPAAAFVTGITALVWNTFPQLTPEQVRYAVVNSGDPINNIHPINGQQLTVTGRRVNAYKAMLLAQELNNDRLFLVNDITVRSTSAGGNWNDPATWVGGAVPTSTDVVEINGNVTVNANVTVSGMLISPGATLYAPGTGSQTLNINGSRGELQNKGAIYGPSGQQSTLTINANTIESTGSIYGNQVITQDLFNRGNITSANLQIRGTLRHEGAINNSVLVFNGTSGTQQLFCDESNPLENAVFDNNVNVTGSLTLGGTTTINSGKTITLPPGSTVRVSSRQFNQFGTLATDHMIMEHGGNGFIQYWESGVPFSGQSVRFTGGGTTTLSVNTTINAAVTVDQNSNVNGSELTVNGVFTNRGNLTGLATLIANDDVINSGTAVLHLRARKNVTQDGTMLGGSITFEGTGGPQTIAGIQPFPYAVINNDLVATSNVQFGTSVTIGQLGSLNTGVGNALRLHGLNNSGQLTTDHLIFEAGNGSWSGNGQMNVNQVTLSTNANIFVAGDKTVEQLILEPSSNLTTNSNTFYNFTINGNLTNRGRIHGRLRVYLQGDLDNTSGYVNLSVFAASWDPNPSTNQYEFQLSDAAGVWQTPLTVNTNSYPIYPYITQTNLQWRYRPIINGTPGNWSTPRLIN